MINDCERLFERGRMRERVRAERDKSDSDIRKTHSDNVQVTKCDVKNVNILFDLVVERPRGYV